MRALMLLAIFHLVLSSTVRGAMNEFESCRCSNGLATKGDFKEEVRQDCGNPVRIYYNYGNRRDCVEMWVYNFGPNEFMQGICFDRASKVKYVLSLQRGY